jgi:hypothetical protein
MGYGKVNDPHDNCRKISVVQTLTLCGVGEGLCNEDSTMWSYEGIEYPLSTSTAILTQPVVQLIMNLDFIGFRKPRYSRVLHRNMPSLFSCFTVRIFMLV